MKTFANTFLKGLLFALPIAATFGLLYWLIVTAENLIKIPLQLMLPVGWYHPGMGLVFALGLIFTLGVLVQAYVVKYIFIYFEKFLEKIPIVKTLYVSARNLIQFFAGDNGGDLQKVIAYQFNDDIRLIGFVTNESAELGSEKDLMAVYFPMSYQIGGYLTYLPREKCEILDIPVKEAMQQVLTAHISVAKSVTRNVSKEN